MRVVIAEAAYADIGDIGRYIKLGNPRRAVTFTHEPFARCRQLGEMPFMYPLVPNHEARGIRRRVYGDYLIFYRVEGDCVEILHVLHGARDYENILFPGD